MHALVIEVSIEKGREDEGVSYLNSDVLPAMKNLPGLVAGYWLGATEGQGLTLLVFDNQEAARGAAEGLAQAPKADFATVGKVEFREVVAHL